MSIINKIIKNLKEPYRMLLILDHLGIIRLNDEKYIKLQYKATFAKELDLQNPKTFNEKLQWLKLYDRNPLYTKMVDKYEVKKYVANIIGEEYIIPTIGVYDKFEDINFNALPDKFVMKCTHDSGSVYICRNKNDINIKELRKRFNKYLKKNFYYASREWPYKDVKPRIIIEKYIGDNLTDYRIYCFNGKVKYIYMYINNSTDEYKPSISNCNIYNENWELQNFHQKSLPTEEKYNKPSELKNMVQFAEVLSKDTDFLRVDFYIECNKVIFSELTFFPGGGFSQFNPVNADYELGNNLKLSKRYFFLKLDNKATFFKYINDDRIQMYYLFNKRNMFFNLLKVVKLLKLIFKNWKKDIKKIEYCILGENGYDRSVTKYIKKKNPNCKIILYYWNIIAENEAYKRILNDKNIDEFWTFDRNDAKKYNMKYNPQFYSKNVVLHKNEMVYDVAFLGRAKNRKDNLLKIKKILTRHFSNLYFKIIENEKDYISYDEYLNVISKSKCILDYNQGEQVGLSLRPMEALFFKKKLITNNKDIVNYDFYNKNNIFVLGIDDENRLKEFIESELQEIDESIVNYYDYESWIKRFKIN